METIDLLVLPRSKKRLDEVVYSALGKRIMSIAITSKISQKSLGKIVSLLNPGQVIIPQSLAKLVNLERLKAVGIEVVVQQRSKGRRQKVVPSQLEQQFREGVISRRTYYYWKKRIPSKVI